MVHEAEPGYSHRAFLRACLSLLPLTEKLAVAEIRAEIAQNTAATITQQKLNIGTNFKIPKIGNVK